MPNKGDSDTCLEFLITARGYWNNKRFLSFPGPQLQRVIRYTVLSKAENIFLEECADIPDNRVPIVTID